jgi:hypothetical protein
VKLKNTNKEATDAVEDTHFTENEKSNNEQFATEGNNDCFLQDQEHNLG